MITILLPNRTIRIRTFQGTDINDDPVWYAVAQSQGQFIGQKGDTKKEAVKRLMARIVDLLT